jgi:hypothetical protein
LLLPRPPLKQLRITVSCLQRCKYRTWRMKKSFL